MIEGVVNANYEPVISLPVQGPAGQLREIDAVVDTGFNGFLTLPATLITELGLPFASMGRAVLANGSEVAFDVHAVTVLWDDAPRNIEAAAADATPWWVCNCLTATACTWKSRPAGASSSSPGSSGRSRLHTVGAAALASEWLVSTRRVTAPFAGWPVSARRRGCYCDGGLLEG